MIWFMLTGPLKGFKKQFKAFCIKNDCKNWAYCIETGDTGYLHVHAKIGCSNGITLKEVQDAFYPCHVEPSNPDVDYLRKKGSRYVASTDSPAIIRLRFGQLYGWQAAILEQARKQTDRQLTCLVDEVGNLGKSWLTSWMFENRVAFWCPPVFTAVKDLIQFICSGYKDEEFIIIDIPRSWKWTDSLYTGLELIKDGLVFDTRYSAKMRNIRGVKLLIFTNVKPKLDKLSKDRWDIIHAVRGHPKS